MITMRNKHKNDYWNDWQNRSFVEDNIKLFEFLTGRGFMIPSAGGVESGGRVVDSFSLMPAWIREQITIDGKKLAECDYTALHPNIAIKLYQGKESYITHQKVAEKAAIDVKMVKVEHLAFFNKKWVEMKKSPLYKYYSQHEPLMLERICKDKAANGYKVTSHKMFKIEVDIMTDVITSLNAKGIQVLYVYDALVCEEQDKAVVIEAMNRIVLEHGVKTSVKVATNAQTPVPHVIPAFRLTDEINLYDVLPTLGFTIQESTEIIHGLNKSQATLKELVEYIGDQRRQQQYNDYTGVPITPEHIAALKGMIRP